MQPHSSFEVCEDKVYYARITGTRREMRIGKPARGNFTRDEAPEGPEGSHTPGAPGSHTSGVPQGCHYQTRCSEAEKRRAEAPDDDQQRSTHARTRACARAHTHTHREREREREGILLGKTSITYHAPMCMHSPPSSRKRGAGCCSPWLVFVHFVFTFVQLVFTPGDLLSINSPPPSLRHL